MSNNNVEFDLWHTHDWQDYDEIKEAYHNSDANRDFPEWYDFYNSRRGTSAYLILPDIRGEKEEFYRSIYIKERDKQTEEEDKKREELRDKRPRVPSTYDKEHLTFFVNTFEDKQTQIHFKAFERNSEDGDEEEMGEIVRILLATGEYVPIQAHYDFREALRQAHDRYNAKKIAEFLPYALEQHRLSLSMGFSSDLDEIKQKRREDGIWKIYQETIFGGRKLNGEPEDFNF